MRQHDRTEWCGIAIDWFICAAFQPREQIEIGRCKPGPDQFDIVSVLIAKRGGCGFRQSCGDTDPQAACHQLQKRPAPCLVEFVQPADELCGNLGLAQRIEGGDHLGQRWRRWRVRCTPVCRPHQCNGFRQVTDIVIGQCKERWIGAGRDQVANEAGLGMAKRQCACQRRQRPAAIRVGHLAKIVRDQPQLVVAAGLVGQTIKQMREAIHDAASSAMDPSSSSP